jgi:hypothetical protein
MHILQCCIIKKFNHWEWTHQVPGLKHSLWLYPATFLLNAQFIYIIASRSHFLCCGEQTLQHDVREYFTTQCAKLTVLFCTIHIENVVARRG